MFGKLAEKIFPIVQKVYWKICFREGDTRDVIKHHNHKTDSDFTDMTFQGEDFKEMQMFGRRTSEGRTIKFDLKMILLKRYMRAMPLFFKLIPFTNDDNLRERINHPDARFWLEFKDIFINRIERSNGFIRNFQGAMNTMDPALYKKWKDYDTPEFKKFIEGTFNSMALISEVDCYYRIQGMNAVLLFYALGLDCQKRLDDNCSKCKHSGDGHLFKMIEERKNNDTEQLKNFANYLLGEDIVDEVQSVPATTPTESYGVRIKKKVAT